MNALIQYPLLVELNAILLSEQQRLEQLLTKTKAHFNRTEPLNADFAEQAVETENDEVIDALNQEAQIELSQINKALLRIERGNYGTCVVCDKHINPKRLQAIPHTPFCFSCASEK